jgi:hypothetical protein
MNIEELSEEEFEEVLTAAARPRAEWFIWIFAAVQALFIGLFIIALLLGDAPAAATVSFCWVLIDVLLAIPYAVFKMASK